MESKEIVFLQGKFLPGREAKITIFSPGFFLGQGLFESMRSLEGKIVYLHKHLERIRQASILLGWPFPWSLARLRNLIRQTVRINRLSDAYVRLTLWKDEFKSAISIIAKRYQPYPKEKYRQGITANLSSLRQNDCFLVRLKTTNRLLYELSFQQAKAQGFAEALILNERGYLAEASRSNIFFIKNKMIFTPDLSCGCLEGITRKVIFDLAKKNRIGLYTGNFTPRDLLQAEEAFLTNSLMGVIPLRGVEQNRIGKGNYKLTRFLMQRYNELLHSGDTILNSEIPFAP